MKLRFDDGSQGSIYAMCHLSSVERDKVELLGFRAKHKTKSSSLE